MSELRLSEIWIYPVKSLGGISVTSARVMEKGLLHDRRWMLTDEHGAFMTQRVYPKMALFRPAINGDTLTITKLNPVNDHASVSLSLSTPPLGEQFRSKVWDDEVTVTEVSDKVSDWFTTQLGMRCRLVSFPEKNPRPVNPKYSINNEHVGLADAYPFLIIGQSSLDDLNARLNEPLPMNRFRPNLVFTGGAPFEEDTWKKFTIGGNRFAGVKPCDRCVLTTVNQDTAEKGVEPLLTLSKYRKRDNKIYFGQNVVALDHTEISVGDKITLN
ncbi:MOSC domain-containing protein [Fulvivirgaceae bacterium PWU4]|uniref:MOSC domain-containing protein n=1 Tax=Chryseosolibacter histidini TaxID=2782349 RepID=A0AAP2GM41_9BACT|nr:MOSC N-terminal beta barrel domain-containing protein [Chryseosolibacter histidini]MBT1696533.1 MOSC domain-containing protein [Chryseosolibacter histidini]